MRVVIWSIAFRRGGASAPSVARCPSRVVLDFRRGDPACRRQALGRPARLPESRRLCSAELRRLCEVLRLSHRLNVVIPNPVALFANGGEGSAVVFGLRSGVSGLP